MYMYVYLYILTFFPHPPPKGFTYYGLRAVLVLYLTTYLEWSDNGATVLYHASIMLSYITPFLGR